MMPTSSSYFAKSRSQLRNKRPFSSILDDDSETNDVEPPGNNFNKILSTNEYLVTQQEDSANNTTNHTSTSIMVIYFTEGKYYICYYDPLSLKVQFIEPLSRTNDDSKIMKNLLNQFKPEELICNSKVKMSLNVSEEYLGFFVKLSVKANKDFSSCEGEIFFNDLLRELKRSNGDRDFISFLIRLESKDDYRYYVSLNIFYYNNDE